MPTGGRNAKGVTPSFLNAFCADSISFISVLLLLKMIRLSWLLHGFYGGKYSLALKAMIHKIGIDFYFKGQLYFLDYFGKVFHRSMVFSSIPTGLPEELSAQCLVNPLQTISSESVWVIT